MVLVPEIQIEHQVLEVQMLLVLEPQTEREVELVPQSQSHQGPGLAYQRRTQARELRIGLLKELERELQIHPTLQIHRPRLELLHPLLDSLGYSLRNEVLRMIYFRTLACQ